MSASEEEEVGVRRRLFTPSRSRSPSSSPVRKRFYTPSPSPPSSPRSIYTPSPSPKPESLYSSSPTPSPDRFYSLSPSSSPSPVRLFSASPATRKRMRLGSPSPSPLRSYLPRPSSPNLPSPSCYASPSYSPNHLQKDLLSTTADSAPVTQSSLSASVLADTLSGKFLFLFFSHVVGPMVASLYAINLWDPSVFSSDIASDHAQPFDIEPIMEFDYKQFPTNMSCVELNSKLYFLGGSHSFKRSLPDSLSRSLFEEEEEEEELKVIGIENHSLVNLYILDICHAINYCSSDTSSSSSSSSPGATPGNSSSSSRSSSSRWSGASSNSYHMLKKGPPMHSEKNRAYVFVAFGKIYVISGTRSGPRGLPSSLDRFEVFDPELDKWTVLDDPPIDDAITSHSVIGDRIYISTTWDLMYSYDPHKGKWRPCWANHSFYGKADSIGTTLYGWNHYTGVTAYGLFTAEGASSTKARASSGVAYLNRTKDMLPLLLMIGETEYSYDCSSPCLVHLGNRVFCYVVLRNYPDPDGPNKCCYKVAIRVTHFELPQDPYRSTVKEGEDPDREFVFDFKFINSAYFVGKSRYGSYKHTLQNCFHVPIQQGTEEKQFNWQRA